MKTHTTLLLMVAFFTNTFYYAQTKVIMYNKMTWFGNFTKISLNDKWSIYLDFGLRRQNNWVDKWSQKLIRPGVIYHLNERVNFAAGVAYFNNYSSYYIRQEWRGWQQVVFTEKLNSINISQRIRTEQRFNQKVINNELVDDFQYNNRFRYQLSIQLPINHYSLQNSTFYVLFSDEVMLNSGNLIFGNYFDQNRLTVGMGFKFNEGLSMTISYLNLFQQKAQLNKYEHDDVFVMNIYQNINPLKIDKRTK